MDFYKRSNFPRNNHEYKDTIGERVGVSVTNKHVNLHCLQRLQFSPIFSKNIRKKSLWSCFLILLLLPSYSSSSHIMTSDSREEPEFEMLYNGDTPTKPNPPDETGEEDGNNSVNTQETKEAQPPITEGNVEHLQLDEELIRELDLKTEKLRKIDELSKTGLWTDGCLGNHEFEMMKDITLSTEFANVIMEKVDMIVSFLYKLKKYEARVRNRKEVERDEQEVYHYILETVKEAYPTSDLRLLIYTLHSSEQNIFTLTTNPDLRDSPQIFHNLTKSKEKNVDLVKKPWYFNPNLEFDKNKFMTTNSRMKNLSISAYHKNKKMDLGMSGGSYWTWSYFNCSSAKDKKLMTENELEIHPEGEKINKNFKYAYALRRKKDISGKSKRDVFLGHVHKFHNYQDQQRNHFKDEHFKKLDLKNAWLASYTAWFPIRVKDSIIEEYGELSLDLDLSKLEINQCGFEDEKRKEWDLRENPMYYFRDTHKCDRLKGTSTCHFIPGHPWRLGSYECRCAKNMYAYQRELNNTISGAIAEAAWSTMRENKTNGNDSIMYQDVVTCKTCPAGCDDCVEGLSCLAPIGWVFRLVLLCVSIICSIGSVLLVFVTYKFRKTPVLKSSSPLFHCITLLGCVIMYSEMIALFPVLSQATCVAVKWTRHLGFCVTYTALYMKLCRVYLTFRVKSAHKIKLTEKHLLHWMSPVMVVMLLYLSAWTISDPPSIEQLFTTNDKKFFQCVYNWWDHSVAILEMIFLCYGVWICWRIRENPDAQFISYSIYNIAFTNMIMVTFHLLIVPQAGPDTKYLLAFVRTQLSTTVTIILVFGSKLLSVLRGDPKAMKDIPTSANGFGHETLDLAEENQQLKEELTKMATQIEKLKSYAMSRNNPHLKHASVNITSEADFNKSDPLSSL